MIPPWLILVPVGFALAAFGLAKAAIQAEEKNNATSDPKIDELGSRRNGGNRDRQSRDPGSQHRRAGRVEPKEKTADVRVVDTDVAGSDSSKPRVNRGDKPDPAKGSGKAKSVEPENGTETKPKTKGSKPSKSQEGESDPE